ncbi:MAG: formylglycine-generating enzyme family protein [Geminicoccaceae bacterium]
MLDRKPCILALCTFLFSCASASQAVMTPQPTGTLVPLPGMIAIPAGGFLAGSTSEEREIAYRLDEAAYGHGRTREQGWYDRERDMAQVETGAFSIMQTPVTNRDYARFIEATRHPAPDVDAKTWQSYRLVHPFDRTRRHAWVDGRLPNGREDHPVVLVSHGDAEAYAAWFSEISGETWRLPSEIEWEKAARGLGALTFPWGNDWDAEALNSHDQGPFDTEPVGSYLHGASPFDMLDAAGQVYEWTSSPGNPGRFLVKGGSWDDKGCGVCRPAARHARPADLKHILVGFRLVREPAS